MATERGDATATGREMSTYKQLAAGAAANLGTIVTGMMFGFSGVTLPAMMAVDHEPRVTYEEASWIGNALGTVVMFILGSILQKNWRLIAGLSVIVPVLSILVVWCFLPESPIWLLSKGRIKEAEISLKRVRNVPPDQNLPAGLQQELDAMMSYSMSQDVKKETFTEQLSYLRQPEAYKPLLILNAFTFFQHFSGCTIIMFYALSIVSDMGVNVDTYVATVVLSVARLVVVVALSYASKRFGRRALCNVSGVGMSLSLTALALFSGLMHADVIDSEEAYRFNWIPVTSLLLFVVTSSLGFFWLPASMMGELFPTKIRGSAAGFTGLMGCCLFFLVVKLYPYLKETMRYHNVFILYAVISVIGTIVMYFYLPETQGKTLAEIEQYFKSGERATRAEHKSLTSLEIHSTKEDNVSSETSRLTCN
ncbi:facilitated trehalose transporter Tret1-2 homolog isoform X2 [Periplaneta americana]|uniref:facilitated trehalose transporter Tret1-2 homolog isoform X2 n=1 Tax=Periplaneta americana TaxID=6978 RepID=UPI0037E9A176